MSDITGQADPPLTEKSLRACFGQFATGVTVVTAPGPRDVPLGITVNSFSSVSLDPPLVLFCLGRDAGGFDAWCAADCFAINFLGEAQRDLSVRFSSSLENPWEGVRWSAGRTGAPLLDERIAGLECEPHAQFDGGDHVILVLRVMHLYLGNGAPPLVYWGSDYRSLLTGRHQ